MRAAQDLQLHSLNRARLEKYLAAIRESDEHDPKTLHERALILARSLSIKVDEQCFARPAMQQASCLMQNSDQLVLDDGHGESMVSTLTQGAGSDLLGAISTTKVAGRAEPTVPMSAWWSTLARLMENLHTAKYQYISALALPQGDQLHLRLNFPPSFHTAAVGDRHWTSSGATRGASADAARPTGWRELRAKPQAGDGSRGSASGLLLGAGASI